MAGAGAPAPLSSKPPYQAPRSASGLISKVASLFRVRDETKPLAVFQMGVANSQGYVDYLALPPAEQTLTTGITNQSVAAGGASANSGVIDMRLHDRLTIIFDRTAGSGNNHTVMLYDTEAASEQQIQIARDENAGVVALLNDANFTTSGRAWIVRDLVGTQLRIVYVNNDGADAATIQVNYRRSMQVHQ